MKTLGTGKVWVNCTGMDGSNVKSLLTEVHYIPNFHTNLITYDQLETNGIYWDPDNKSCIQMTEIYVASTTCMVRGSLNITILV